MAYFAVQPVVYLVAWILLHVKGARENRSEYELIILMISTICDRLFKMIYLI